MRKFVLIMLIIFICLGLYGIFVEPKLLNIKEFSLYFNNLESNFDGMKIVHFSDLLYQDEQELELLKKVINNINEQKADIVIFTGDLIKSNINKDKIDVLKTELSKLNKVKYMFAIKGDKDNQDVINLLEEVGFKYINNNYELIFNEKNIPIAICNGNIENIDYFKINITHKPDDYKNLKDYDLVLAGHSLGGLIRLPIWGGIINKSGAKTYKNEIYDDRLYINFGIGEDKFRFRLFNKPSINVYRLYASKNG